MDVFSSILQITSDSKAPSCWRKDYECVSKLNEKLKLLNRCFRAMLVALKVKPVWVKHFQIKLAPSKHIRLEDCTIWSSPQIPDYQITPRNAPFLTYPADQTDVSPSLQASLLHPGLNRTLHTYRGAFDWDIINFHPGIGILIVRKLQKRLST